MKERIAIGQIELAGKPLTAEVYNFENSAPRPGTIRFRDAGQHFVLEQFVPGAMGKFAPEGAWYEVMCYVKPS